MALKDLKIPRLLAPKLLFIVFAVLLNSGPAIAVSQNAIVSKENKEESIFDRIWGLAVLYEGDRNSVFRKIAFTGRYHGQYYWADGDSGSDNGWAAASGSGSRGAPWNILIGSSRSN